jgi:hypothetical protein
MPALRHGAAVGEEAGASLLLGGFYGEAGGFPGGQATGDFGYGSEVGALEEAGGKGGAVASGAIDEERAIFGYDGDVFEQVAEREAQAAGDKFLVAFAGSADVDGEGRLIRSEKFRGELGAEAVGKRDEVGTGFQTLQAVFQIAGDVVKADTAKPDGGFVFAAGRGNDDDRMIMIQNGAGPGGVLAVEADVDAAGKMSGTELFGFASVQDLRAFGLQSKHHVESERLQLAFQSFVQRGAFFAVENGVIDKIGRGVGLVGGDQVDEGLLGHGLQGVVQPALLAHGGDGFLADGFAAERARAVGGVDEAGIWKGKQFRMEGVEEQAAEVRGGPPESDAKIGAADVTNEQSVSGEDRVGLSFILLQIVDEKRRGFGSVAGSFEGFEADTAEFDDGAVRERSEAVFGLGFGTEIDCGADTVAEFEVAGNEIGVEMGEEDVFDLEVVFRGEGQVAIDVALRVDDGGCAGLFVADEVGGVRQTV